MRSNELKCVQRKHRRGNAGINPVNQLNRKKFIMDKVLTMAIQDRWLSFLEIEFKENKR